MKKRWLFVYLCMIFLTAACQATPEEEVVVQKDTEEMLAMASEPQEAQPEEASLRETLGVPDSVQETLTEADGKLIININTEVRVPEVSAVPIMEVVAADFLRSWWTG